MNHNFSHLAESKTFCMLPWIHLHVLPDSTVIPCCVSPYDDTYGDGKKQSLKEIWNSDKFKQIRKNMLAGLPTDGCARCYQVEKSGFKSLRESFNDIFEKDFGIVEDTKDDGSLPELEFRYIDIRFSNLCNFKCRGCGPTLSSSWHEDHQALFDYRSDQPKVKGVATNSPYFWEEIKKHIPHAEKIYFGGGEPLITKEHYEVLKLLDSLGKYHIRLSYNTNLAQLNYGPVDLAQMWSKFNHVTLGISIDDIGKRAEYFRHGTKWEVIERNLLNLRDNYKNLELYINCTVNIMNIYYLPEIFLYLTERQIIDVNSFNINLLLDPIELSVQVLPISLKIKVRERLESFIAELSLNHVLFKKVIDDFNKIINFMDNQDRSDQIPLFQKNTLKLDKIRNEDFKKTYPELIELLETC